MSLCLLMRFDLLIVVLLVIFHPSGIPTMGKNVVVAGRSKNVGMPIAMLLHTDGRHERPGGWLLASWHLGCPHVWKIMEDECVFKQMSSLLQVMPRSQFLTVTLQKSNFANTLKSLTLLWLLQVCARCLLSLQRCFKDV